MEQEKNREERFLEMVAHADSGWKLFDKMIAPPIRPKRSVRFFNEDLEEVGILLSHLEKEGGIEYLPRPSHNHPSTIVEGKYFETLVNSLNKNWISYIEIPVVSISSLPVEEQRRFRRRR